MAADGENHAVNIAHDGNSMCEDSPSDDKMLSALAMCRPRDRFRAGREYSSKNKPSVVRKRRRAALPAAVHGADRKFLPLNGGRVLERSNHDWSYGRQAVPNGRTTFLEDECDRLYPFIIRQNWLG